MKPPATILIAIAALAAAAGTKQPVPDADSRARARMLFEEIYQADFSKPARPQSGALAKELLLVAESENDAANRYVLLRASRELAVAAGDGPLALRAVERIVEQFTPDGPTDRDGQLARGHELWEKASGKMDKDGLELRLEAAEWYLRARPSMKGLLATLKVDKRLASLSQPPREPGTSPYSPPAKQPKQPTEQPSRYKRRYLPLRVAIRVFDLQPPKWRIEGECLAAAFKDDEQVASSRSLRGSSLEFGFKIKAKWHQKIQVSIDDRVYCYCRGHWENKGTMIRSGEKTTRQWGKAVSSADAWCSLGVVLKDNVLRFYYNDQMEWAQMVPKPPGKKHAIRVCLGCRRATVQVRDFYLQLR